METEAARERPRQVGRAGARAAAVALAVLALLALIAVASGARGRGTIAPAPRSVPLALFDYLYTFGVVVFVASLLSIFLLRARGGPPRRDRSGFLRLVVFMGLIMLFGYLAQRAVFTPERVARLQEVLAEARESGGGAGRPQDPRAGQPASFRWEVVAVFSVAASVLVAFYVLRRVRRRRGSSPEPTVAEELVALLEDTLEDLRAEEDARRAVIAAYARMERTLAAHGLPRWPAEAPLEYLARVLRTLEVPAAAALDLTALFERAKFSPHAIDRSMKDEAIAALVTVRDDLRAAA